MNSRSKRGFTLVELLVTLAVISTLTTFIFFSVSQARERGRIAAASSDLGQLVLALKLYLERNGEYPCSDDSLSSDTQERTWSAPYINWPRSPWGNYHWDNDSLSSFNYSLSLQNVPSDEALGIDNALDDGNLGTGLFRTSDGAGTDRYEYGAMNQSVAIPADC